LYVNNILPIVKFSNTASKTIPDSPGMMESRRVGKDKIVYNTFRECSKTFFFVQPAISLPKKVFSEIIHDCLHPSHRKTKKSVAAPKKMMLPTLMSSTAAT